ncbi:MAG: DUF4097 domain-containing protein [Ruminococcaceae bacterium]|nr:DUF4097 domain-containing protein [Oscillospiraceae bacterium]
MKENLKNYLTSLFINARDTARNSALFEELLGNLCDRYDELIAEGAEPADAYAKAIGELGDIAPLIEKNEPAPQDDGEPIFKEPKEPKQQPPSLGKRKQLTAEELRRAKHRRGLSLALSVMLYIVWLVPTVLFEWGVVFLFICAAAGTVLLVHSTRTLPHYVDDSALTYSDKLRRREERRGHILFAGGIGLCILCLVPTLLAQSAWGVALMFALAAIGVGAILYSCQIMPDAKGAARKPGYVPLQAEEAPERGEKKANLWLLPIVLAAAVLLTCACIWAGANGIFLGVLSFHGHSLEQYVNEGDASVDMQLEHLEIDWRGGTVRIEVYDGTTVEIAETAFGGTVEAGKDRMRWYEEDGALHIRFDGYGDFRLFADIATKKDLVVRIPRNAALELIELDVTSAICTVEGVTVNAGVGKLDIDTVSGSILLRGVTAGEVDVSGVSATVTVSDSTLAGLEVETVSGNVMLQGGIAHHVEFSGVSGSLKSSGCSHGAVEAETASGKVTLDVTATLRSVSVDTVSGDVHLNIAADVPGFTAELDSTSGDFECSLSTTPKDGAHVWGDGSCRIVMDSTSGNLVIMGAN